jgi:ketosteroid isomerase-like protein
VGAFNAHNLDAWVALCHAEVTSFQPLTPFPVDGKAVLRQVHQTTFTNHESGTVRPTNPQFRVVGTHGMAWMHKALVFKPKNGPLTTVFVRVTIIFAKSDGK